jgi:hypothetical protein
MPRPHEIVICAAHRSHQKTMRDTHGAASYDAVMTNVQPGSIATRTLTLVLPESDWRALREAEPDAIAWLHERIRERLSEPTAAATTGHTAAPEAWSGTDEY